MSPFAARKCYPVSSRLLNAEVLCRICCAIVISLGSATTAAGQATTYTYTGTTMAGFNGDYIEGTCPATVALTVPEPFPPSVTQSQPLTSYTFSDCISVVTATDLVDDYFSVTTDGAGEIYGWGFDVGGPVSVVLQVSNGFDTFTYPATAVKFSSSWDGIPFGFVDVDAYSNPSVSPYGFEDVTYVPGTWTGGGPPCTPQAPNILFNGANVAGQTTTVVVGQEIMLTGQVPTSSCSAASQQWSLPMQGGSQTSNAVGGYMPSEGATTVMPLPSDTTSPSYGPFYFAYTGTYTMTYEYTTAAGVTSPVSTATFTVSGPTGGTMTVSPYGGGLTVDELSAGKNCKAALWLIYGNATGSCSDPTGTPGIRFKSTGYKDSSGGIFSLVQLVSAAEFVGAVNHIYSVGLDDSYPYGNPPDQDSPHVELVPSDPTQSVAFTANMFLMWQSSTANSIPVPLGYQTWEVDGSASCTELCDQSTNWTVENIGSGPVGGFTPSNASQMQVGENTLQFGYPTWTGLSK